MQLKVPACKDFMNTQKKAVRKIASSILSTFSQNKNWIPNCWTVLFFLLIVVNFAPQLLVFHTSVVVEKLVVNVLDCVWVCVYSPATGTKTSAYSGRKTERRKNTRKLEYSIVVVRWMEPEIRIKPIVYSTHSNRYKPFQCIYSAPLSFQIIILRRRQLNWIDIRAIGGSCVCFQGNCLHVIIMIHDKENRRALTKENKPIRSMAIEFDRAYQRQRTYNALRKFSIIFALFTLMSSVSLSVFFPLEVVHIDFFPATVCAAIEYIFPIVIFFLLKFQHLSSKDLYLYRINRGSFIHTSLPPK